MWLQSFSKRRRSVSFASGFVSCPRITFMSRYSEERIESPSNSAIQCPSSRCLEKSAATALSSDSLARSINGRSRASGFTRASVGLSMTSGVAVGIVF